MHVPLGDTYYFLFTTRAFASGAPTTLSGTPVLSVYEENNATQITSGVAVTADYDSVTGLNECSVVATGANGYEAGKYYSVVITTGTVGGVSVVGEVVGHFRVMPAEDAGAGIPDVNATHLGDTAQTGRDIGASVLLSPGTGTGQISLTSGAVTAGTVSDKTGYSLTATTGLGNQTANITGNLSGSVGSVTGAVGSVTGNVGGNVTGSVGSISGVTFPTNFGDLSITVTTGLVDITQTAADKAWDTTTRVLTANTNLNDPTAAQIRAEIDSNSTQLAAIVADTNELQTDWANGGRLDLILDARASQTTADAIEADTQDIQSRIPAALVGGRIDADIGAISTSTTAANNLEISALHMIPFTVTGTPTSTVVAASGLTSSTTADDQLIGRVVIFTSGNAKYEAARITDYVHATGTMTLTELAVTPTATDTGIII